MVRGLGESAMVDVDLGGSPTGSSVGAYCWGYLLLEIRCWLVYLKNYMMLLVGEFVVWCLVLDSHWRGTIAGYTGLCNQC